MDKRRDTCLSEQDRMALEQVVKKLLERRACARVKTLLLLGQTRHSRELSKMQGLNISTEPTMGRSGSTKPLFGALHDGRAKTR